MVSALLHGVAILLYPLLVGPPGPGGIPSALPAVQDPPGMEVVQLSTAPDEEEPLPAPREPLEEAPSEPAPVPQEVGGGEAERGDPAEAAPSGRPRRSAAEELRPRASDPRLWADLPDEITDVSPQRMAELRLIWAMESMRDSAAAAAAAAAAATDWTYTDEDGGRWGVSPGKIHLGDLTLPLPFSFGAPWNSDAARRAREDAEINRAAEAAAARETQEERAEAIRERREHQRSTPPDTTGGSGGGGGSLP